MLLQDLKLIEASAVNITFKQSMLTRGQGSIKVEYGTVSFEAGGRLTDDESKSVLVLTSSPQIIGISEGAPEEDNGFLLQIDMRMVYIYDSAITLDESFITENTWYFSSFLRTYFKFYAESILQQSTVNGIKLPLN